MGHVTAFLNQNWFGGYEDDSNDPHNHTSTPPTTIAISTNWTQAVDTNFRLAIHADETNGADGSTATIIFQYQVNGGGWANITTTTPAKVVPSSAGLPDNTLLRQTVNFNDGVGLSDVGYADCLDNSTPTVTYSDLISYEICLQLDGAQLADGDQVQFRLVHSGGTLLDSYSLIPTITTQGGTGGGDTTPPEIPTNIQGTPGDGQVTLTWTDPPDADLNRIEIYRTDSIAPVLIGAELPGVETHTDTGLSNGTEYEYNLVSVDDSENSSVFSASVFVTPQAAGDTTPPATPTNFQVTGGDAQVTLTWTDPADADLTQVVIYRSVFDGVDSTDFVLHDTVAPGVESYLDSGLTNGFTYSYYLEAEDEVGNASSPTTPAGATPTGTGGGGGGDETLVPSVVISAGTWTGSPTDIDEQPAANDADFIASADGTAPDVYTVRVTAPSGTPSGTGTVNYRYAKKATGTQLVNLVVSLINGATGAVVASNTHNSITTTFTDGTFNFSTGSITDWSNVQLRFERTGDSGGSPSTRSGARVSWAEVDVSTAPAAIELLTGSVSTTNATLEIVITQAYNLVVESVSMGAEVTAVQATASSDLVITHIEGFVVMQDLVIAYNVGLSPPFISTTAELTSVAIAQEAGVNPDELSVATGITPATITQAHAAVPTDASVAEEVTSTTITQAHVLTVESLSGAASSDSILISAAKPLTTEGVSVSEEVQATTLTQTHAMTVESVSGSAETNSTPVTQAHDLTSAALSTDGAITPVSVGIATINLDLTTENASVNQEVQSVTVVGNSDATVEDAFSHTAVTSVTLFVNRTLTTEDAATGTEVSEVTLSGEGALGVAAASISAAVESVALHKQATLATEHATVNASTTSVELSVNRDLTLEDANVSGIVTPTTITSTQNLTVQNVTTTTEVPDTALVGAGELAPANMLSVSEISSVGIERNAPLSVSDVSANAGMDAVAIVESISLLVGDIGTTASIDAVELAGRGSLAPESVTSGTEITSVTLTGAGTVVTEDAYVNPAVGSVAVVQNHALAVGSTSVGGSVDNVTTLLTKHLELDGVASDATVTDTVVTQHHLITVEDVAASIVLPDIGTSASKFLLVEHVTVATTLGKATFNLLGEVVRGSIVDGGRDYAIEVLNELYDVEDATITEDVVGGENTYAILDAGNNYGIEDASN